jgi:hypothetical protein
MKEKMRTPYEHEIDKTRLKRSWLTAAILALLFLGRGFASAQSLDDLKIQVHGYATQGFLYSTNNNWNTTSSSDGSAAWTEAVVNLTAQPIPKLRIGVQARYFLLGTNGNAITLDWAQADYKVNERFGVRVGKIKSPNGLLNQIQDIDPAYLWTILPQSVYPLANRDSLLAHYGGLAYGSVHLGEFLGKLEYQGFGGQRVIGADDSYLQPLRDIGISLPSGAGGIAAGAMVTWDTPLQGLAVGANISSNRLSGQAIAYGYTGQFVIPSFTVPDYFARYERNKIMVAAEYTRRPGQATAVVPGVFSLQERFDPRGFYGMASYKVTGKLTAGAYYSSSIDRAVPTSSARFQKDWALSARYDLNPFLYLKAEQHFVDGTELPSGHRRQPQRGPKRPLTGGPAGHLCRCVHHAQGHQRHTGAAEAGAGPRRNADALYWQIGFGLPGELAQSALLRPGRFAQDPRFGGGRGGVCSPDARRDRLYRQIHAP